MAEQYGDPRERVIDAADALFYSRGIRAVGMDDVRNEAGVSLKRLYALFPGTAARLARNRRSIEFAERFAKARGRL